jgi:acetyltransferase-like isoleucine patch superfamily enzyme/peptidoglycan/LPS O-acetylase OafA/YrhL
MTAYRFRLRRAVKVTANVVALIVVWPAAVTCWIEAWLTRDGEGVFAFWTHTFALFPGIPGALARRAFYRLTLDYCDANVVIGFGALFAHRRAVVEPDVVIGPYAVLGSVVIHSGTLVGTRASLLSGSAQHTRGPDGRWTANSKQFQAIDIGRDSWIGESAVVMADVGESTIVAAGAVVSTATPPGATMAGNPARCVRREPVAAIAPIADREADATVSHRITALDWMKSLGLALIVYGHVAAWTAFASLDPVYTKQLGVAFFVFATGYSLAREKRAPWRAVYRRLFEVYAFGIVFTMLLSAIALQTEGRPLLSNYLPFMAGANVVFDFFPANPTSWYVGTFIHLLLLWAVLLRRLRMSAALILGACAFEIAVRAALMQTAGLFVAYMLLTNWMTVLLAGMAFGQRTRPRVRLSAAEGVASVAVLGAALLGWKLAVAPWGMTGTFPFMQMPGAGTWTPLLVSALVTLIYTGVTTALFKALEPLRAPAFVRFIARNTVVIFLAHMPIVFALTPVLDSLGYGRNFRALVQFLICLPGLAIVSEALKRRVAVERVRDRLLYQPPSHPEPGASGV